MDETSLLLNEQATKAAIQKRIARKPCVDEVLVVINTLWIVLYSVALSKAVRFFFFCRKL